MPIEITGRDPESIAFLLLPDFTMMPVTSIIESLRLANYLAERPLYSWTLHSKDGKPAAASNGLRLAVNGGLTELPPGATLIVCGGHDVERHTNVRVIDWLAKTARSPRKIGGICTGVEVLAQAGLLDGYSCTLHWESLPQFRRKFPHLKVTSYFYDIDRERFTCAGGTAAVDMTLAMITARHGASLATAIAERIIHSPVRTRDERQPNSVSAILGTRHPKVLAISKEMEVTLDMPLSPSLLAKRLGLSTRQLERLFLRYIGCSPKQYHQQLRLRQARQLLIKTEMSVTEVSAACGFSSPSYFSRCYSTLYNYPPKEEIGIPKLNAA